MKPSTRARTTFSTQDHLELKDIIDDLVISRNNTVAMVIQTTAVNFDLLSEYEQDNKIFAFAGLLNSLNFHIQILIRTKRIDISNYVRYLKNQLNNKLSEGTKRQLTIYTEFIQNLIVQNEVLDKKFYIVIPYTPASMSAVKNPLSKLTPSSSNTYTDEVDEKTIEQAKIFLYPKRDHILKQLGRMGLNGHQLTTNELIEVFYDTYNPES